jgi:hypothetical protein
MSAPLQSILRPTLGLVTATATGLATVRVQTAAGDFTNEYRVLSGLTIAANDIALVIFTADHPRDAIVIGILASLAAGGGAGTPMGLLLAITYAA